ncbi:PK domain containing protein [Asbolus verrucosus]|uniref:Pyruvate kinase n=1 Tax=Asbolus verrucosus TaxID=1661398 RepID=A0A482V880_ASBVE|nr:PK domain containing protein [Asbolus verrucosus]
MVWTTIYDRNKNEMGNPNIPPQQLVAGAADYFLDHNCELDFQFTPAQVCFCGVIRTIGPASRDPEMLEKMMETGMNIARLNFSHGSHGTTPKQFKTFALPKKLGMAYPLAIALDTKGPEIRTGLLEAGGSTEIELKKGETIKLTTDKTYAEKGNSNIIYIDYDNIQKVVQVGNKIYVDDGLIWLVCTAIQRSILTNTIENGRTFGSRKGINLLGVPVVLPAVSEKDKSDLVFAVQQGLDMVFASFIRGAALTEIRNIQGPEGRFWK